MAEIIHYHCGDCDLSWTEDANEFHDDDGLCPRCDNPTAEDIYEEAVTE